MDSVECASLINIILNMLLSTATVIVVTGRNILLQLLLEVVIVAVVGSWKLKLVLLKVVVEVVVGVLVEVAVIKRSC